MSIILSPMRSQQLDATATNTSPMITNMTPLEEPENERAIKELDANQRYEKPPPLHTGADWKVVLHLPEIENWLRMTSERVRDLTYSVQQDTENKHVDVHLVQLKDICEDISDHVELIHALLETEISLKLLSYSVNILVDIHTVQLLWHQLRVSVLVLRERILQGLQDSNGNYTRQTDILQAFSEDRKETCLDSLTEVDDAGQLTIKCSKDYFSLDCGITAFELSDYSPSEDVPCDSEANMTSSSTSKTKSRSFGPWNSDPERGIPELDLISVANGHSTPNPEEAKTDEHQLTIAGHQTPVQDMKDAANSRTSPVSKNHPALSQTPPVECTTIQTGISKNKIISDNIVDDLETKNVIQMHSSSANSIHCENATPKRTIKDCFNYNEDSPTQPSLPKRALYLDEISKDDLDVSCCRILASDLSHKAEISRSTPILLDHPDRSKLRLDLPSSYPSISSAAVSHSYDELNKAGSTENGYPSLHLQCNLRKPPLSPNKVHVQHQRKPSPVNKSCDLHDLRQSNNISLRRPKQQSSKPLSQNINSPVHKQQNAISVSSNQTSSYQKQPEGTFTTKNFQSCCAPHIKALTGENNNISEPLNSDILTDNCKDINESICESFRCQNQEIGKKIKSKSPIRQSLYEAVPSQFPLQSSGSAVRADSACCSPALSLLQQETQTENSSNQSQMAENDKLDTWFGSNEYLALPSHLKETEVLALKLENLTKLLSHSPEGEALRNIDDWELSETNSVTEVNPSIPVGRENRKWVPVTGTISPTSSSDIAPSLEDSIESGPLSDILSDDEPSVPEASAKHHTIRQPSQHWLTKMPKNALNGASSKTSLIQQLQEDIQQKQNNSIVWEKIEGFVNKLDELICWLFEAMETTENWTPPKADTNSLKLYLETHLSFKLNVDSHCALKDAVVEEGQQLLELIESHKSGLRDMLQIIASQWQELQRQIKRQHSWILGALDIIKAEILATDVTARDLEGSASPKGEIQLINLETRRDAVEQMSLKLYSEQYTSSNKRKQEFAAMSKVNRLDTYSLLDFESEYQELWDWLIDMESIVMDSHDLMMSEEQQQHLYKGYSTEMAMWLPKKIHLLKKVESLRQSGNSLPCDLFEKVDGIKDKWHLLEKTLGEKTQDAAVGPNGAGACNLLSPESSSLVRQLEVRIKELKGWMRDTELFIFNSCLLQEKEGTAETQKKLQHFKVSLSCIEPGLMDLNISGEDSLEWDETDMSNNLIGIQDETLDLACKQNDVSKFSPEPMNNLIDELMLDHYSSGPGESLYSPGEPSFSSCPYSQQHHSLNNLQLLGRDSSSYFNNAPNFSNAKLLTNLRRSTSKDSSFSSDDSLPDLLGDLIPVKEDNPLALRNESESGIVSEGDAETTSLSNHDDQVQTKLSSKSLHPLIELKHKDCPIQSCICKRQDSFGKNEVKNIAETQRTKSETELSKKNQSQCLSNEDNLQPFHLNKISSKDFSNDLEAQYDVFTFYDYSYLQGPELELSISHTTERKETPNGNVSPKPVEIICKNGLSSPDSTLDLATSEKCLPASSSGVNLENSPSEIDDNGVSPDINETDLTFLSQRSSVESLSIAGDIFRHGTNNHKNGDLHRSTSLDSWGNPCKITEELFSLQGSGDISISSDAVGELSKRTLDLLKRLENIQNPISPKLKRSVSDITLQSNSLKTSFIGQQSFDAASSANEDSAASLTELSSSDDLSLCSEDIIVHKNRILDSNVSFKKRVNHSVTDEADTNISMIVNVSCTSACTDEEDDSDLLSSSTLTLTEEELCIKDDDDSSIATDDDINEENNRLLDRDYMKNEFHHWIKPIFSVPQKGKKKLNPKLNTGERDRCKADPNSIRLPAFKNSSTLHPFLNSSLSKQPEFKECKSNLLHPKERHFLQTETEARRHSSHQLKDDVENGNVEKSSLKDEKELSRMFDGKKHNSFEKGKNTSKTHTTECLKSELFNKPFEQKTESQQISVPQIMTQPEKKDKKLIYFEDNGISPTFNIDGEPTYKKSLETFPDVEVLDGDKSAIGEYEGKQRHQDSHAELMFNCHGDKDTAKKDSAVSSSHHISGNRELEEVNIDCAKDISNCTCHSNIPHSDGEEDSSVHNFVKEIIDMASSALKNISQQDSEMVSPTSVAQIKEKVLKHSHRALQLRKGDFYSYLSISSHDSDCGEVNTCIDEKSSTPLLLDLSEEARLENNGEDENFLHEEQSDKSFLFDPALQKDPIPDELPLLNDELDIVVSNTINGAPFDQNTCDRNLSETKKVIKDQDTCFVPINQTSNPPEDNKSLECDVQNPYLNSLLPTAQRNRTKYSSENEPFSVMSNAEMVEASKLLLNRENYENISGNWSHGMKINPVVEVQSNDINFEKPKDTLSPSTKTNVPQNGHAIKEDNQGADCKVKEILYRKENYCDGMFNLSQKEISNSQKHVKQNLRKEQNYKTIETKPAAYVSHHSELLSDSHAAKSVPKKSGHIFAPFLPNYSQGNI
ncbi:A-kinase anchor protein 6 isoform X3 [Mobula birostris]|uniref:A-kinase anchor protein 6 isoform X3 n=1 Tax=Mobula birostris TaxID=1983395 RepID=UPI003B280611